MKIVSRLLLLLVLSVYCISPVFGQEAIKATEHKILEEYRRMMPLTAFDTIPLPRVFTTNNALYKKSGKPVAVSTRAKTSIFNRTASASSCKDSSFVKQFLSPDRRYSFAYSAKTMDGGVLISGYGNDKNLPAPPWYAVLTKFDKSGDHVWSHEIAGDVVQDLVITQIKELSDGSIIVTGPYSNRLYYNPPNNYDDFFIAKLTPAGNLVWFKTFHASQSVRCSNSNLFVNSIEEGANGDLLFAGTVWNCPLPKYLAVFKLNANGAVQWKHTYLPEGAGDAYGVSIFYEGNVVTVINKSDNIGSGRDNVTHTDLMKLDYGSGSLITYKAWKIDLPFPDNFYHSFTNAASAIKLENGNYCLYGGTVGVLLSAPSVTTPQFSVLEFNSNYDFVNGYTIEMPVLGSLEANRIKVDRYKRVLYSVFSYTTYPDVDLYIGSINNDQIINQRKREYRNQETHYNTFEIMDDGSYVLLNTLATVGQSSFSLEYSLMHNADIGSACLGLKSDFSRIVPAKYIPHTFKWELINSDPFYETNNRNTILSSFVYTALPPCTEKVICDTVKIHGNPVSCNYKEDFIFTGYKNPACGSAINWNMSREAVQLFETVNDTTVRIKLKNEWQGWLYAYISTSCEVLKDSVFISAFGSPGAVNIGPDKQVCAGNTVLLNAGRGYASYLWNNGSTDSLLVVSAPGTYYVNVKDGCGNLYNDTIKIVAAPPLTLNIGADRTKCNNDTLHLRAPTGFLNYAWGPNYALSSVTTQNIIVQPAVDTVYYVRAEKTPGCFAYDTVSIKVNASPPINAGPDKSFCNGDSAVLNAGAGFNEYRWSNGNVNAQTTVFKAGVYSVVATTASGCRSYDTVRILNVWPNPVIHLDKDSGICMGITRKVMAGTFNSYKWQDGSNLPYFNITGTGTYYVTVTDNNSCQGSDTLRVNKMWPTPSTFLPADTTICNYGTLQLGTTKIFSSYAWNNGTTKASLAISSPGTYWLQVKDEHECIGKDTIVVLPRQCLEGFHIPNAFTPGTNSRNNNFKPIIGGIVQQYRFSIYNRWGQQVYVSTEINKGWNGIYKGSLQDPNMYVWTCTYQLGGEPLKKAKGTFMLIR